MPLSELVFLARGPLWARALVVVVAAAGAGVAGTEIVRLQQHYAAQLTAGTSLNGFTALLAHGSSLRTLWPGWLAAVFFTISLVRLLRGPLEPAGGFVPIERQTVGQLRRGLRREYAVIRAALAALILIAAVQVARVLVIASLPAGSGRAVQSTLGATAVEAAGFVVAAAVLLVWAATFRRKMRMVGAA